MGWEDSEYSSGEDRGMVGRVAGRAAGDGEKDRG